MSTIRDDGSYNVESAMRVVLFARRKSNKKTRQQLRQQKRKQNQAERARVGAARRERGESSKQTYRQGELQRMQEDFLLAGHGNFPIKWVG